MAQFAGSAHWAETSPLVAPNLGGKARPSAINCKNVYLMFALGAEPAAQAVVGSNFSGFRVRKKELESRKSQESKAPAATRFVAYIPKFLPFFLSLLKLVLLGSAFNDDPRRCCVVEDKLSEHSHSLVLILIPTHSTPSEPGRHHCFQH